MAKSLNYINKQITSGIKDSFFLFLLIALFSLVLILGNVVTTSLNKGISNTEKRLGADVMIVPSGSRNDAENIILTGQRSSFYFDKSVYQKLTLVDGIENITAQCFLKSLSQDCCSSEVQIVFFDPDTDFVVEPWISEEYSASLNIGEVIVGSGVDVESGTIKLFNHDYNVVAQLSETGTSIDNSVYFTFDTKDELISLAAESGSFLTDDQKDSDLISSVYINIRDDADLATVIKDCHLASGSDFDVVYPKQLSESLSGNLKFILRIIDIVMISSLVVITVIIFVASYFYFSKRKQEVAILRVFGNSKKNIIRVLLTEVNIRGLLGPFVGIFLAWLFVIPFGNYIGYSLNMPYLGPDAAEVIVGSIISVFFVLLVISLSSLFSIIQVTNMGIYDALRKEAE